MLALPTRRRFLQESGLGFGSLALATMLHDDLRGASVAEPLAAKGRDHNPNGFTIWMAGAGVKGGFHYGATDEFGYKAVDKKVHVNDLHATLLHLLGLEHTRLTHRFNGRDFRLTDVGGEVITEILA